jgi:hypothetical protein
MDGATLTLTRETTDAPAVAPTCSGCGDTDAPDGTCLNVGACSRADGMATRGASRGTAKFRQSPAAWSARGYVD